MELSVHFIDFLPGAPDRLAPAMTQAAVAAEEAGATMFTLADHFFQMEEMGRAQDPFLEAYTTLAFLAGQTRTIALAPRSRVSPIAIPVCWPRRPPRWTCCREAVWYSASERRGTSASIWASACPTRPFASDSRCSKRRCRFACRCGARTRGPTRASTIGWRRRSVSHNRFGAHRS